MFYRSELAYLLTELIDFSIDCFAVPGVESIIGVKYARTNQFWGILAASALLCAVLLATSHTSQLQADPHHDHQHCGLCLIAEVSQDLIPALAAAIMTILVVRLFSSARVPSLVGHAAPILLRSRDPPAQGA